MLNNLVEMESYCAAKINFVISESMTREKDKADTLNTHILKEKVCNSSLIKCMLEVLKVLQLKRLTVF